MVEIAVVVLGVGVLILAGALFALVRWRPANIHQFEAATAEQTVARVGAQPVLASRRIDEGTIEIFAANGEVLVTLRPLPSLPSMNATQVWPAAGPLMSALVGIGGAAADVASHPGSYAVRFSPQATRGLRTGVLKLSDLAVARDVATGQFVEIGKVVAISGAGAMAPHLLLSAAVVGVITAQLQEMRIALRRIEAGVDELSQRVRDDDHGELAAANRLVEELLTAFARQAVPRQLALELAVARQRVEGIHSSRQRFVDRFREELETAQDLAQEKSGKSRALTRSSSKAVRDVEAFADEVLLYAKAMVVRSRVAMATAAIMALDGHPAVGRDVMLAVQESTLDGFHDLARRLRALGAEEPRLAFLPFDRRRSVFDLALRLAEMLDRDVGPCLPERTPRELEFVIDVKTENP
jgi:hypothetical protein